MLLSFAGEGKQSEVPLEKVMQQTGEMLYTCETCQKTFTHMRNLKRHVKDVHGEKKFVCEQCGESFTRKVNLERHQKRHSGSTPHICMR